MITFGAWPIDPEDELSFDEFQSLVETIPAGEWEPGAQVEFIDLPADAE